MPLDGDHTQDAALGSPSRVVCRKCGTGRGQPCRLEPWGSTVAWMYCDERVADLRALLGYAT